MVSFAGSGAISVQIGCALAAATVEMARQTQILHQPGS
jgi:hypothetical protein